MATQENVRDVASLSEPYRTLISAAILAPSGDNLQPWKFEIDEANRSIAVIVDETRDTSPMNAGQRMSRIACGACAENIVRTAEFNHWAVAVEFIDSTRIQISLEGDLSRPVGIPVEIRERHTNRKIYRGQAIDATQLRPIEDAIEVPDGIEMQLVANRERLSQCAEVVGRADAMMFGQKRFLNAFLENVRFDQPIDAAVDLGLSIGSLALTRAERILLPRMGHLPDAVLKSSPLRRAFAQKARKLVESASGLCLINAHSNSEDADFEVGRTMQRVWLALTKFGFAVQPMMSLPVLLGDRYFSEWSTPQGVGNHGSFGEVAFEQVFGRGTENPCAILRFGHAKGTNGRTGRTTDFITPVTAISDPAYAIGVS